MVDVCIFFLLWTCYPCNGSGTLWKPRFQRDLYGGIGFCCVSSSFPGLVRSSGFTWHDMNHTAAFGWIGLSFFLASSLYLAMMRILRDVAARVVFRMNCLLQFFTPEELHRLEVRWDTTVFKLVSLRERFWDQSFKAGLSSVWVFGCISNPVSGGPGFCSSSAVPLCCESWFFSIAFLRCA